MHSYLAPTDLLALRDIVPTGSAISHFSADSSTSMLVLNLIAFWLSSFLVYLGRFGFNEEFTTNLLRLDGLFSSFSYFFTAFTSYFFWILVTGFGCFLFLGSLFRTMIFLFSKLGMCDCWFIIVSEAGFGVGSLTVLIISLLWMLTLGIVSISCLKVFIFAWRSSIG